MWVTMWVTAAKRYLRYLFSEDAIPWVATNLSAAQIGTEVPEEQVKGFER